MNTICDTNIAKLQVSGNSKSLIIPRNWLYSLFGQLERKEILKRNLYIDYEEDLKVIKLTKNPPYFNFTVLSLSKTKIQRIGTSFGVFLPMKMIRHMFQEIFGINYQTNNLNVELKFNENESSIEIKKI